MVLFYRRWSRSPNFWRTASAWLHCPLVHGLLWPDVAEVFEDGYDVVDDELVDAAVRGPLQYVAERLQSVPRQHLECANRKIFDIAN